MAEAFRIMPDTFVLPNEYVQFVSAFQKTGEEVGKNKNLWIMKVKTPVYVIYLIYSFSCSLFVSPEVGGFRYSMMFPKFAMLRW